MKKIFLFLILIFSINAFACGGCRDSYLGDQKANEGINSYDNQEKEIAKIIENINNKIIKDKIIKNEEEILSENKKLLKLEKNNILSMTKESFLLNQKNQLQNLLNSILVQ